MSPFSSLAAWKCAINLRIRNQHGGEGIGCRLDEEIGAQVPLLTDRIKQGVGFPAGGLCEIRMWPYCLSHWHWVEDEFLSSEIMWFYRLHTCIHAQQFISSFISEPSLPGPRTQAAGNCWSCAPHRSGLRLPPLVSHFPQLFPCLPTLRRQLYHSPWMAPETSVFLSHFLPALSPQPTVEEVTNGDKGNLELKSTGKEIKNKAQTGISYYGG